MRPRRLRAACVAICAGAGPASAQGAPTLYGIVDAAVEWSNAGAARAFQGADERTGSTLRLASGQPGNAKGSRLGLRGAEDLGGGLRAVFAIEHRVAIDTGEQADPAFWNGQAWVGLEGAWGRLTAGRQYTPMFSAMIAVDATADQWYGTLASGTRYATRFDNGLEYRTPRWNGLQLLAMMATDEAAQDRRDRYALGAIWQSGSWLAAGAWQRLDAAGASGATVQYAAGFAWRAGPHQVGAGWMSDDPSGSGRRVDYPYLSARFALGRWNLYVNLVGSLHEADRKDSVRYAIALDRPLSRRTRLYVAGSLDTDLSTTTPAGVATYVDGQRLSVGVRHDF